MSDDDRDDYDPIAERAIEEAWKAASEPAREVFEEHWHEVMLASGLIGGHGCSCRLVVPHHPVFKDWLDYGRAEVRHTCGLGVRTVDNP